MSAFSCMQCWPKLCSCKSPLAALYVEWAGAGFFFEGTVMRRDDGLTVVVHGDGKAYIVDRFMPEDLQPISFVESKQVSA